MAMFAVSFWHGNTITWEVSLEIQSDPKTILKKIVQLQTIVSSYPCNACISVGQTENHSYYLFNDTGAKLGIYC